MFRSYEFEQSTKLKPQEDLENISFFELGKSYDMCVSRKFRPSKNCEFTRWSDKDQESFLNFSCYREKERDNRKQSADNIFKRTSCERMRWNHSVTFQTKKIDLGAKASQSMAKSQLRQRNSTMYLPASQKMRVELNTSFQNKRVNVGQKIISNKIQQRLVHMQKGGDQNPEKHTLLQTQASYNFINYPVSVGLIRKRKLKKLENFPFPSLALRLNK